MEYLEEGGDRGGGGTRHETTFSVNCVIYSTLLPVFIKDLNRARVTWLLLDKCLKLTVKINGYSVLKYLYTYMYMYLYSRSCFFYSYVDTVDSEEERSKTEGLWNSRRLEAAASGWGSSLKRPHPLHGTGLPHSGLVLAASCFHWSIQSCLE